MQDRTLNVEQASGGALAPARNFGLQLYPRMTEAKWLTSDDAGVMLDYVLGRVSQRKLRLFAVACCRRLPEATDRRRDFMEAAELNADGCLDNEAVERMRSQRPGQTGLPALDLMNEDARWAAHTLVRYSPWHAANPPLGPTELADLLRHIVGNPFRLLAKLERTSATLQRLAEALYAGEDCAFALRDALLEEGQTELAEHFAHPHHPKGCWALDLILGRE